MGARDAFPRRAGMLALVTAAAVVLVLAVSVVDATSADPRDDKRRADAAVGRASSILENATARARAAARRLDAVSAALPGARGRVADAHGRVVAAAVGVDTARRQVHRAQRAMTMAKMRYERSAQRVVRAREQVANLVSASYKGGDIAALNFLLDSRSAQDVTRRSGYFDSIIAAKHESVDHLMAARTSAKQDQLDAESARRRAEQARAGAESALGTARTAQRHAVAAEATLRALATERASALAVARQERAESLRRYRRARAEAIRVRAELRAWQAHHRGTSAGPVLHSGARFQMPVRGWKSSDFGMRLDPFFHVWQLHAGVDLAAPGGQPIFAAASGRVIRAGYNGGYGNFTCISHGTYHGRGLSTCYAHQSRILVFAGQWVRRGQVIGRVGSTGSSTGNHLHFEVRLNGEPRQPLNWLPSCLCLP